MKLKNDLGDLEHVSRGMVNSIRLFEEEIEGYKTELKLTKLENAEFQDKIKCLEENLKQQKIHLQILNNKNKCAKN